MNIKKTNSRPAILIADDSEINRALVSTIFSDEYQVEEACDGIEALEKLHSLEQISAVILDLMMPRLDGYGVLKQMMQDEILRAIPVIVVTGADDTDSYMKALDVGAVDVIVKPFNSQIMIHKVRNIVQRGLAITEMEHTRLLEQRLLESEIDPKTGILNRQTFCFRTAEMIQTQPADDYVLILWDVDHFRMLNDRCGTDAGDRFLKYVGQQYQQLESDDLICGWVESDHFGLCGRSSVIKRRHIEQKLLRITDNGFEGFDLISRIGIYEIEDPSMDAVLMIDRAMLALRSVKENYEQRIGYYKESMRKQLVEEQEISDDMETALKTGQFKLYLQPQCNYAQNTIHGAEALVRWIHPTKGKISPAQFIPIFEHNGFITRMDAYMWEEACRMLRCWIDKGMNPVPISVNISRRDISTMEVTETFVGLTEKYQIDHKLLHCEVTESAYIQEHDLLVKTVMDLQKEGFIVEMDDFGSGYSSLNFLKDVPVDVLKLDMKFLEGSTEDNRSGSILTSVIRMTNWLQLPVIAEGVETRRQADYLKSVGCFYLQGYFYAKPMPADEFSRFIENIPIERKYIGDYFSGVKGAEDYLSASTQATMLFNSFVGGAAIIEYDGVRVEALRLNDKFYEEIGADPLEYAKERMHILDRLEGPSRLAYLNAIQEAIRTNQETSCITVSKPFKKGQEAYFVRNSFRFLVGNAGRYILYVSIQNMTEFMKLMNANKELITMRTSVLNNVPCCIQTLKIKDNRAEIIYFNDRAASQFGYTRKEYEEAFGTDFTKALHPEDVNQMLQNHSRELRKYTLAQKSPIELRHISREGSWKWVRIRSNILKKEMDAIIVTTAIEEIEVCDISGHDSGKKPKISD
ncbi:MAG: EAL domain-containing protein [Erysipelotrichia bacterium]|nr:EAL domain-containing protein [Erysipelotrichia bacterium]